MVLLFLVIGSKITAELSPPNLLTFVPVIGFFTLAPTFSFYFFILIFLIMVLWLSKRTMPAMAEFIIQQATNMAGMAWQRVGAPLKRGVTEQARLTAVEQKKKEKETGWEMLSRRQKLKAAFTSREGFGVAAGAVVTAPTRWAARLRGTTPEVEERKEILKKTGELKERFKEDREGLIARLPKLTPENKIAAALALKELKGDKALSKISEDQLASVLKSTDRLIPKKLDDLLTAKQKMVAEKIAKTDKALAEVLDRWTEPDDTANYFRENPEAIELWRKSKEDREKVKEAVRQRKAFSNMKVEDYENMTAEMAAEDEFLEGAAKYCKSRAAITRMLEKGILDWGKLAKTVEKLGIENIARTNSVILAFPYTAGGRAFGLTIYSKEKTGIPTTDRAANRKIKEIIEKVKEELTKEAPSFEAAKKIAEEPLPTEKPREEEFRGPEKKEIRKTY